MERGIGGKFLEGVELEIEGKVVVINMSKMNSMWILMTAYIDIFTEALVLRLV